MEIGYFYVMMLALIEVSHACSNTQESNSGYVASPYKSGEAYLSHPKLLGKGRDVFV